MALRSGCTPGMAGASKALKSLLFDGGDGAEPGKRKIHTNSVQNQRGRAAAPLPNEAKRYLNANIMT